MHRKLVFPLFLSTFLAVLLMAGSTLFVVPVEAQTLDKIEFVDPGPYKLGDHVQVKLTFSAPVKVGKWARVALMLDSGRMLLTPIGKTEWAGPDDPVPLAANSPASTTQYFIRKVGANHYSAKEAAPVLVATGKILDGSDTLIHGGRDDEPRLSLPSVVPKALVDGKAPTLLGEGSETRVPVGEFNNFGVRIWNAPVQSGRSLAAAGTQEGLKSSAALSSYNSLTGIPSSYYAKGHTIKIDVRFTEPVNMVVRGDGKGPYVNLILDGQRRIARLTTPSLPSKILRFEYTVQDKNSSLADGISDLDYDGSMRLGPDRSTNLASHPPFVGIVTDLAGNPFDAVQAYPFGDGYNTQIDAIPAATLVSATLPGTKTEAFDVRVRFYNDGYGREKKWIYAEAHQTYPLTGGFSSLNLSGDNVNSSDWTVELTENDRLDFGKPIRGDGSLADEYVDYAGWKKWFERTDSFPRISTAGKQASSGGGVDFVKVYAGSEMNPERPQFLVYTFRVTPPDGFQGDVKISVPQRAVADIAGNDNLPSNLLTLQVDTKGPEISSAEFKVPSGQKSYTSGDTIKFEIGVSSDATVRLGRNGDFRVTLLIGTREEDVGYAGFDNRSNPTLIKFEYPITDDDAGQTIKLKENSLMMTGTATIRDDAGNNVVRTFAEKTLSIPILASLPALPASPVTAGTLKKELPSASISPNGYAVISTGTDATTGIASTVTLLPLELPNLEAFFQDGGTIDLMRPKVVADGFADKLVISEIMWGSDATQTQTTSSQWIELYNPGKTAVDANLWRLQFTSGDLTTTTGDEYIDKVSNLGLGYWTVPGQSGRTVSTKDNSAKTLISMVRDGSKNSDGIWVEKDGTRSGHWAASARPSINLSGNRIGTPGADKSKRITSANKPSIPASPFRITEIGNGADDKNDWIEVQNVTDTVQNLKDKVFSIVTGTTASPADTQLFKVDTDVKIPAKAFLLIANTSPEETALARGHDLSVAAADLEKSGVQSYYHVESELKLPSDGNFLLVLRSEAKPGKSEKFIDVVGTHFIKVTNDTFNTEVWPLQATAQGHTNIIDGTDEEMLKSGYVYTRGKDNAFAEKALARAGYTGVGYDRDAPNTPANGGTPGYANDAVKENPVASTVSISELMFDNRNQLPQWIELYNASHTQAVKLNDWTLKIEQSPGDDALKSRVTLKFTGDKIISPNQTLLIVTTRGRSSTGHFPETRVINLWNDYREKLDAENRRFTLLSQKAFRLTLASKDKKVVDEVGNYDDTGAAWELPTDTDERSSLIRRYGTKVEDSGAAAKDGTLLSSWKLASKSTLNQAQAPTYYGSQDDAGTPGYRAGGPLPVSLSSFTAIRTDGAIVVTWATASELNNAGFNLLRSTARTGAFTQVNPQLIAGAGTTGERSSYRYTDTSAKPNTMYYYRIEEVSTAGVKQALETTRLKGYLNAEGKALEPWATLKTEE